MAIPTPTDNPVGSTDARDQRYNAAQFDIAMNGAPGQKWVTRDGQQVMNVKDAMADQATLAVSLANDTDPAKGAGMIGWFRSIAGFVGRWVADKLAEQISVKDFGAVGDGVADDSDALQAAVDYIRDNQWPANGNQWTYRTCYLFFPEGTYKISRQIEVRAAIVMKGVGNGYVAGSTIRQTAPDTNIFTMISSGSDISGLNFEFESQDGSGYGYALDYPAFDPVAPFGPISSNSHYIRRNRFGGTYRYGRFVRIEGSNDVEISHNVVDVIIPGQCITIGSQVSSAPKSSDVRIVDNNFFAVSEAVVIHKGKSILIGNNCFSNQYSTGSAIKLVTDAASPVAGSITGVNITGNIYWRQYNCLTFDGSASNVNYNENVHTECLAEPILGVGALDYYRFKFHNNDFHLSVAGVDAYPYTYSYQHCPLSLGSAKLVDSEICDTQVDANGLNTVTKLFNSAAGDTCFGSNVVLRNNYLTNNTTPFRASYSYVPTTAADLEIRASKSFSGYPVAAHLFSLNSAGIPIGSYGTLNIDYVVGVDKPGEVATAKIGTVKVSFARLSANTADTKWQVVEIAGVSDDTVGGGAPPAVTISGVSAAGGAHINVTVSGGITGTFTTKVSARAYAFTASGGSLIRTAD